MIKFLVIVQDLRVSGTSEGIVSRSFLGKLRKVYPEATIDVVYLKQAPSNDQLELIPVDNIETHILNLKIPFFTKWYNKLYWRLFHISLKEKHIHKVYASYISKIEYQKYAHIFIRSAGLEHETILASRGLPILSKAIVNFHDPYPLFWYSGSTTKLTSLELFRLKNMQEVVSQAKTCMSSANLMSEHLQFLYGSKKMFYTLPHQYDESLFNIQDSISVFYKTKKIAISYHGALQFGRNIEVLLDCYLSLINTNKLVKDNTEFFIRLKSSELNRLKEKYALVENITFLEGTSLSDSIFEQKNISDVNILLENGPISCNILLGKTPLLASIEKSTFTLSPKLSEIRNIITDDSFLANYGNEEEIKTKLENLIINRLNNEVYINPFGDYFSDENFKLMLDRILEAKDDL
jgi:hypothetical protein